MAKILSIVALALFVVLAAAQCNEKSYTEFVPRYDDFTTVIDYANGINIYLFILFVLFSLHIDLILLSFVRLRFFFSVFYVHF